MNNNTKMIVGLFAAVAAGVAVGMLLAPAKGKETRESIKDGFGKLTDKVKDLLEEGQSMLSQKTHELRDNLDTVKDDLKTTAHHTTKIIS